MRLYERAVGICLTIVAGCASAAPVSSHELSEPGEAVTIHGLLKTESGKVLDRTAVLGCMATSCLFSETDEDGRFEFVVDSPATLVVKTHEDVGGDQRLAATMRPLRVSGRDRSIELGVVFVPELPAAVPIQLGQAEPQTVDVGDGLELTVRASDLEAPLGDALSELSARRIPKSKLPPFTELDGEEIVGVYALQPFAAVSRSPVAVRAQSDLPPQTTVKFRTVSELDGRLSDAVPGSADGSFVSTDAATGIAALSWLVVSR